jgi:signal transduction histidine kinase
MRRTLAPALAAILGLAGSLAATLYLFRAAEGALERVLDERLRGAGESAALLLGSVPAAQDHLRDLMVANGLDGAYLLDRSLVVIADAGGRRGQRADLLRVDPDRVQRAFEGVASVAIGYSLGDLAVTTGCFPVRGANGAVTAVLGVEAGQAFVGARRDLSRARNAAVALSILAALALGAMAARWTAVERLRRREAEQAARGDSITRMGAMVAHEIRNPLGVIRATMELMRERGAIDGQRERIEDVLGEVERMRRLTDDFLILGAPDRPLVRGPVDLAAVLIDSSRATEATYRGVRVVCQLAPLPAVSGDPHRLRQVFANLLANAAQAKADGEVEMRAEASDVVARVQIHDQGPGIPPDVRERLFDPFLTTKAGGTGLGLAIARMLVERHSGSLTLVDDGRPGATFEVRLPLAGTEARAWPASS